MIRRSMQTQRHPFGSGRPLGLERLEARWLLSAATPPTTSGIADVNVYEDAANEIISLHDAFEDAEDADTDMYYQVVGNSNPTLFDSTEIDSYGGYGGLTLDFAQDAFGEAELTVRATDLDGLWVETSFFVDVAAVNDPPVITDFYGIAGLGTYWTFSGTVTDVDDDVAGMVVDLGGILAAYEFTAVVQQDGTFSLTREFPDLQNGSATAQTEDDQHALSNLAWDWIVV